MPVSICCHLSKSFITWPGIWKAFHFGVKIPPWNEVKLGMDNTIVFRSKWINCISVTESRFWVSSFRIGQTKTCLLICRIVKFNKYRKNRNGIVKTEICFGFWCFGMCQTNYHYWISRIWSGFGIVKYWNCPCLSEDSFLFSIEEILDSLKRENRASHLYTSLADLLFLILTTTISFPISFRISFRISFQTFFKDFFQTFFNWHFGNFTVYFKLRERMLQMLFVL